MTKNTQKIHPVSYRVLTSFIGLLAIGGCNALPTNAPTEYRVLNDTKDAEKNVLHYQILPITPAVTDILEREIPPLMSTLAETHAPRHENDIVGPGDMLAITIFELGNGLFGATDHGLSASGSGMAEAGPPQVSSHMLPSTQVEANGSISVPYVGSIHVAGLTPQKIAQKIQDSLKKKSQNPQVMVHIVTPMANTVIVSGEVRKPGRVVLSLAKERLSDLIAIAGGASQPPNDSIVELVRGEKIGITDLFTLESHPSEDIAAIPGDRLRVIYQPRSFTAFGALRQMQTPSEIPFKTAHLSLADALARIGGPSDNQADAEAVFLFRYEDPVAARQLQLQTPATPKGVPVVYKINLLNATDYFLAQRIPMKNHDVILIGNAATQKFYKMNALIGTIVAPAMSAGLYAK